MRILLTGAAGFICSHIVEHIIRVTDHDVVVIDKLSYSSKGWSRLNESGLSYNPRVKVITWDLECPFSEGLILEIGNINVILHLAAESHVDKSIKNPVFTIRNNIMSTLNLLEYSRSLKDLKMFQYFSTDEVFGPAAKGVNYKEWDRHHPMNPYAASKAASEDICLAYTNTYKLPIVITNMVNSIGERQYVEKFLPLVIKKVLNNEEVEIFTDENNVPGGRFYIHARNVADAVLFIINNGNPGEKYNISSEHEIDNLQMAKLIASAMNKELKYKLVSFQESRPGNDIRYSLDGSKLKEMGWVPPVNVEKSIIKTVKWTLDHKHWLIE